MKITLHRIAVVLAVLAATRLVAVLLLLAAASLSTGCKSITKAVIGLKDDKAALYIESMSMGGAHRLKRMNPGPGHSVIISPDGTMKMEWVGNTNAPAPIPVTIPLPPGFAPAPPQSSATPMTPERIAAINAFMGWPPSPTHSLRPAPRKSLPIPIPNPNHDPFDATTPSTSGAAP